ncbi:MAG: cytochrome c1, partial [Sphingomicrobium sp.]
MRFILGFIGAVFAAILLISFFSNLATYFRSPPAPMAAEEFHREAKELRLASDGPFGKFDKRQLQRGFQVYSEVCSACHSLKFVSFHHLTALGYNDAEIKKIASDWKTQV